MTRQENARLFIEKQKQLGNEVYFPADDMRLATVYNKEDLQNKHYRIFDNVRNQFIRKVAKQTQ